MLLGGQGRPQVVCVGLTICLEGFQCTFPTSCRKCLIAPLFLLAQSLEITWLPFLGM